MKKIKFPLEGPLQSWGAPSLTGTTRGTESRPTKRGVVGLIGACMGLKRGDPELSNIFNEIKTFEVKVVRRGEFLNDFQTVKPLHEGQRAETADHKYRPEDKSTQVLHKHYLMDASFEVTISGSDELIDHIYNAMNCPIWPAYLGRAACTPTTPILPEYVD